MLRRVALCGVGWPPGANAMSRGLERRFNAWGATATPRRSPRPARCTPTSTASICMRRSLLPAGDRARLENLCRYVLRPPIAQERLQLAPDGTVVLRPRRPWSYGTRAIHFEPSEFLEKLASLVPKPRIDLAPLSCQNTGRYDRGNQKSPGQNR